MRKSASQRSSSNKCLHREPRVRSREHTEPCACRVCRFLLTFKNFSRGEQQEGRHSKQATDNFIHVDGAVVASTPAAGLTCKLFSSLLQLKALPN